VDEEHQVMLEENALKSRLRWAFYWKSVMRMQTNWYG
jgi:hypothetical protein